LKFATNTDVIPLKRICTGTAFRPGALLSARALFVLFAAALITLSAFRAEAQRNPAFYDYPQNHLDWYTIESDHFLVHFQEGSSRPAQVASRIAEEVYEPITELYGHEPEHKVSILIIDRLDYSNGAAFFYDNKIEIWLPSLDTPLRGTHNWLRNVITHEFTHIVQLQASMKQSRRHPATYVQWLSYEDVRRPDVLYGFPSGIITYPLSGISMPAWLAEGTAQYMREEIYYDDWDSHRDMLLRTRILDGSYLSLEKMGTFDSKTSLERELVYNQGFDFTRYLADRFGEESIADITREFSQSGVYDVRKAIKNATGTDGRQVFEDWIEERRVQYEHFAENRDTDPEHREIIEPDGFFNFYPTFHPDGNGIAYLSNKFNDGAIASLFFKKLDSEEEDEWDGFEAELFENPESSFSHSHHGHGEHVMDQSGSFIRQQSRRGSGPAGSRAMRNLSDRAHLTGHDGHSSECHLQATSLRRLETSFSYSPDGKQIAYSRARLNKYGERYRDIYIFDSEEGESRQLTQSRRLQDPVWSPDGKFIATGKIEDGSVNLHLYDIEADSLIRLTEYRHGEQLYRPAWHPDGNTIYISYSDKAQRGIYKLTIPDDMAGSVSAIEPVLTDAKTDYRNPVVSSDGRWLYYSADPDGVFNIYRKSLENGQKQQLTNVVGGAFMPHPHPEKDKLAYSEYDAEGYKIAVLDLSKATVSDFPDDNYSGRYVSDEATRVSDSRTGAEPARNGMDVAPEHSEDVRPQTPSAGSGGLSFLNDFDDTDIDPLPETASAVADTGTYHFDLSTRGSSSDRSFYSYDEQFTTFQFYPVIRFDNYSRLEGRNSRLLGDAQFADLGSNLWRDFKVGTYFASREMRENFSIFGGALFGPGSRSSDGISNFFQPSRLVNLDRDLFLEAEYRGIPFIERHWSPTVSVSFFNIRRNVRDGLQIEEFPCTSCLPDTTSTDIAYNMWQAEVNLISKINQWSIVELGYYYSPYRVETESFVSREFREEVSGSTARYYIGSTWTAAWIFDLSLPDRHGDIAPTGWRGLFRYSYSPSELLDSYDIRDGTLIPIYNEYDNHSVEADLRVGFDWQDQRFNLRSRFFTYFGGPDEYFYLDYIGGMIGMRSYPYFALGGNTTAFSTLSWFVPLKTGIYRQQGRLTLDKVFLRLFAEAGNAWGGPLNIGSDIKTGVGAELRVGMNSYYFFPSSFYISGAYGFNSYELQLPEAFITETPTGTVDYGQRLLINFGLLFDFEF